jgi:hypothetical protein
MTTGFGGKFSVFSWPPTLHGNREGSGDELKTETLKTYSGFTFSVTFFPSRVTMISSSSPGFAVWMAVM